MRDLLPVDPAGLDARRVHEALELLRAADLDRLETDLVAAVVRKYQVSRDVLAFDTSNFDSYTSSANPSRLLKRGHAKSKRTNLRVLGLGMLVTADDDGLPLERTRHGQRSRRSRPDQHGATRGGRGGVLGAASR